MNCDVSIPRKLGKSTIVTHGTLRVKTNMHSRRMRTSRWLTVSGCVGRDLPAPWHCGKETPSRGQND